MAFVLTCVVQDAPPSNGSEPQADPRVLPAPGDPRLWAVLKDNVGEVTSLRSRILQAHWNDGDRVPDRMAVQDVLRFPGMQEAEHFDTALLVSIVVRSRGRDGDSLATLFSDWCHVSGFDRPVAIWVGHLYELRSEREATDNGLTLADSIERMLTLGERSGVFAPAVEEAKVLRVGESLEWKLPEKPKIDLPEAVEALRNAAATKGSLLRGNFQLSEVRPRVAPFTNELSPALAKLLWSWNDAERQKPIRWSSSDGPVHFVVGLPRRPDSPNWSRSLRVECEKITSLLDRGSGFLTSRGFGTRLAWIERLSSFPLAQGPLPATAPSPEHRLVFLGPWDSRNPIVERRLECFLRTDFDSLAPQMEVLEGSDSWLRRLSELLIDFKSFEVSESGFCRLAELDVERIESQRIALVWAKESWVTGVKEAGFEAAILGRLDTEGGGLRAADREIFLNELKALAHPPSEVAWNYPELRSPTYGYEKATLFPDRYIARIMSKDRLHFDWQEQLWSFAGGERLRSAPFRNPLCSSIDGFRWTDGGDLFAEAIGSVEAWSDVDPRAAGIAAVDAALRILVSLGARPHGGGEAMVYMTTPTLGAGSDAESVAQGSYLLAAQGICQALDGFGFRVRHFNGCGASLGVDRPEIRVVLRTKISESAPQIVPGFRMSGEPIYAVGPRPAFMDSGSLLLSHVKVISNHLSKLAPSAQLGLYDLIWGLMEKGIVTSIRPVREGGLIQTVAEMSLWGGMGAQIRPNIPTIELFSGAPGRFVVGILPSEVKRFESMIKSELLTPLGTTGGDKILGLTLDRLHEARKGVLS